MKDGEVLTFLCAPTASIAMAAAEGAGAAAAMALRPVAVATHVAVAMAALPAPPPPRQLLPRQLPLQLPQLQRPRRRLAIRAQSPC